MLDLAHYLCEQTVILIPSDLVFRTEAKNLDKRKA